MSLSCSTLRRLRRWTWWLWRKRFRVPNSHTFPRMFLLPLLLLPSASLAATILFGTQQLFKGDIGSRAQTTALCEAQSAFSTLQCGAAYMVSWFQTRALTESAYLVHRGPRFESRAQCLGSGRRSFRGRAGRQLFRFIRRLDRGIARSGRGAPYWQQLVVRHDGRRHDGIKRLRRVDQ